MPIYAMRNAYGFQDLGVKVNCIIPGTIEHRALWRIESPACVRLDSNNNVVSMLIANQVFVGNQTLEMFIAKAATQLPEYQGHVLNLEGDLINANPPYVDEYPVTSLKLSYMPMEITFRLGGRTYRWSSTDPYGTHIYGKLRLSA